MTNEKASDSSKVPTDPDETISGLPAGLEPGSVLGDRYEILKLLGQGGMGAVFKARDRQVNREVALKVIRPDLLGDPKILERFQQELILSRQVAHKNVLRIFDMGEADGIKFISMEYIKGRDLKAHMREKGKYPPEGAVDIIRQISRGLNAAHEEGVIHRDLKPRNVMVDTRGKVSVMDFGIARSLEDPGATRTGAWVGTPAYMSPEQVRGEKADQRSDIFSLGIIFYELLTGRPPYKAHSAYATMMKRTHARPVPPVEVDPEIPQSLSKVVEKCLQIEAQRRYQSALEVLAALGPREGTSTGEAVPIWQPGRFAWRWIATGLAMATLVAGSYFVGSQKDVPTPVVAPMTVLVADFQNNTGETVFDGTLESMFTVAVEGASFVNSYQRSNALRVASELRPDTSGLPEDLARLVAVREGVNVVVVGSIEPRENGYAITVKAVDAMTEETLTEMETVAGGKDSVLPTISELSARVRQVLGDTTPASVQLAAAETFTARSLEAAHAYAEGQDLFYEGKFEESIKAHLRAVELDPDLGRAYATMASAQNNIGRQEEAEETFRLALSKIDHMTDREKFRTRASYYLFLRDYRLAIEELSSLVERFPADSAGQGNLALAYFIQRDLAKAVEQGRRAVEISPRSITPRNNLALFAMYAGDFETAVTVADSVLVMNSAFEKAYVAKALSALAEGKPEEAADIYAQLEAVSPRGASYAAIGLADIALYEGRLSDAEDLLVKGADADILNSNKGAAAHKLAVLARLQATQGKTAEATATAERAVDLQKGLSVVVPVASVYSRAGRNAKAFALSGELGTSIRPEPQAYAKLIEGEVARTGGDARKAIRLFHEAQELADTWLGRFYLGRAYLDAGAFTEAHSEFETCLKRRGEATAVFFDDVPSYHYLPPVYYYLGRAQEGLGSPAAADSYSTFIAIKEKGDDQDPLVADARRRLNSL